MPATDPSRPSDDARALDAIALALGTAQPNESPYVRLSHVVRLIATTGRPRPGDVPPDEYRTALQHFNAKHSASVGLFLDQVWDSMEFRSQPAMIAAAALLYACAKDNAMSAVLTANDIETLTSAPGVHARKALLRSASNIHVVPDDNAPSSSRLAVTAPSTPAKRAMWRPSYDTIVRVGSSDLAQFTLLRDAPRVSAMRGFNAGTVLVYAALLGGVPTSVQAAMGTGCDAAAAARHVSVLRRLDLVAPARGPKGRLQLGLTLEEAAEVHGLVGSGERVLEEHIRHGAYLAPHAGQKAG